MKALLSNGNNCHGPYLSLLCRGNASVTNLRIVHKLCIVHNNIYVAGCSWACMVGIVCQCCTNETECCIDYKLTVHCHSKARGVLQMRP